MYIKHDLIMAITVVLVLAFTAFSIANALKIHEERMSEYREQDIKVWKDALTYQSEKARGCDD